jgi:hypothetical protein
VKLLSFILSFSILIQFQLISPWPAQAENKALLSSIEKAKVVLVKVEKDIDENMKSMASTCLYAASSLKELSLLQSKFMDDQIEDFSSGIPDALELEVLEDEINQIKRRYKRAHCTEPLIIREQLKLAHKDVSFKKLDSLGQLEITA